MDTPVGIFNGNYRQVQQAACEQSNHKEVFLYNISPGNSQSRQSGNTHFSTEIRESLTGLWFCVNEALIITGFTF